MGAEAHTTEQGVLWVKIWKMFYQCIEFICCACLVLMVLLVSVAVVGRYIFHSTPAWSEEMALLAMTWIGMLSASLAEFNGTHIRITVIDRLKRYYWFGKVQEFVYFVLKFAFSLTMLYFGIKLTASSWVSVMGGVRISVGWKNLAAPLAGGAILIMLIGKLIFKEKGGKEDG